MELDATRAASTCGKRRSPPEYENQLGKRPAARRPSPGDQVFVYTGEGILTSRSVKDGKILWSTTS